MPHGDSFDSRRLHHSTSSWQANKPKGKSNGVLSLSKDKLQLDSPFDKLGACSWLTA